MFEPSPSPDPFSDPYPFHKYLLSTYYMPGTVLSTVVRRGNWPKEAGPWTKGSYGSLCQGEGRALPQTHLVCNQAHVCFRVFSQPSSSPGCGYPKFCSKRGPAPRLADTGHVLRPPAGPTRTLCSTSCSLSSKTSRARTATGSSFPNQPPLLWASSLLKMPTSKTSSRCKL